MEMTTCRLIENKNSILWRPLKCVCVTGCDSGFGHNLAKNLDKAGIKVYAGVLEEFGPGAQELREVSSSRLTILQIDITNTNQISEAHKLIKSQTGETGNFKSAQKITACTSYVFLFDQNT